MLDDRRPGPHRRIRYSRRTPAARSGFAPGKKEREERTLEPHVKAAKNILDIVRRQFGVPHDFREVDATRYPHLSLTFYAQCESTLKAMGFRKIMDIEDVTVRSCTPDPRCFLRLMSNPESRISAAIYHAKPKFPWLLVMFLMGTPSKVYEFQSQFSDDAFIETSRSSPIISNSYPEKIRKQFFPQKSIEELYRAHQKASDEYLSLHPDVSLVPTDSFSSFLEHNRKTYEMTKAHLEGIGWVTKEYLCKQTHGNTRLADAVYAEIQNILAAEKSGNRPAGSGPGGGRPPDA